jgi:hypothetical protein
VIIALSSLVAIAAIVYILGVRPKDLPEPEPVSPFRHLDERKAAIYDNLRDLQFEYRVGKLSDADYEATKKDLQKELAVVMAEVDRLKASLDPPGRASQPSRDREGAVAKPQTVKPAAKNVCEHCGASFAQPLKFCGECGKPMRKENA